MKKLFLREEAPNRINPPKPSVLRVSLAAQSDLVQSPPRPREHVRVRTHGYGNTKTKKNTQPARHSS